MKRRFLTLWIATLVLTCAAGRLSAEEIMTMESTITGSQEQPQVMSIVPWQPPEPATGLKRAITPGSMANQILQPLDRDVFKREVHYYDGLNSMIRNDD